MTEILRLKKANCKSCYKCIRHCPVKSIRFSGNQAHIVGNECILCGECCVICPQNAKESRNETEKARVLIQSGAPVYVSLAPSFVANFPGVGIRGMREAVLALGFAEAEETAIGATIVKRRYDEMLAEGTRDILISSCCHSVNLLIQKFFPRVLPYLADVVSPMQAHALDIKRRRPDAKVVFVGPCVAKKDEAEMYEGIVDAVLTFEELTGWLKAEDITLKPDMDATPESKARFFPVTGGILASMEKGAADYTYMAIDGAENCIAALEDIEEGRLKKCFVEMSICVGSCTGGPVMEKRRHAPVRDYIAVSSYAGPRDFPVADLPEEASYKEMAFIERELPVPSETELLATLQQMGKKTPLDELNCGCCGYDSCREKAVAVYQGKADLSMCLPFLKARAESFSDNIISNTPNGVLVLNENLEVQQINKAAMELFNLKSSTGVLGEPVVRILDPQIFMQVKQSGQNAVSHKAYLAEYGKYVVQSVLYDKEYHILISIMRDVTEEEAVKEKKDLLARQTVEITDKVVEKQMRIVQEIASLLGETTAETKVALSKLKGAIDSE